MLIGWNLGQAQDALSLSDAILLGLEKNYDLQVTRNNEEIASINNNWGNTNRIPSINFSLTGRENFNVNSNENYLSQTITPDLSLNWVMFDGFTAKINKARFEELEKQSQGNTVILVENTIQDIILAYNNCLLQQEVLTVYEELSNLSRDRYQRSQDSKEIGTSTSYDVLQAKTFWLEDQSNYLQQQLNLDNAVRSLNFLIAEEDNKQWVFTTALDINTTDYDLQTLNDKLLQNNSTLKNQYLYQSLLAKETKLAQAAYLPKVNLNLGTNYNASGNYYTGNTPNFNQNSLGAYVGVTVSYNIFSGGARDRSVQIAKVNEETALVQTQQMEHSLNNQLLQIYSTYEVQKDVLDLATEQEKSAKLNLDLSAEKLNNGSITSFNYRDVQVNYLNAAVSKFRSGYNLIQSRTDLLRITGGIVEEYE